MKTKLHINIVSLVFGIGYLAFMGGLLFADVGELPECSQDPYTWQDPLLIMVTLVGVYLMGFFTTMKLTLKDDES